MARDQDHDPLYGLIASMSQAAPQDGMVKRSLQAIRTHLDMEVAYVSEFVGDQIVFREVDAPGLEAMIKPGDSRSLDEVYCRHILEGRLPELIPDTSSRAGRDSDADHTRGSDRQAYERPDPDAGWQRLRHVLLPRLQARSFTA